MNLAVSAAAQLTSPSLLLMTCQLRARWRRPASPRHLIAALLMAGMSVYGTHALAQSSVVVKDTIAQRVVACAACHGKEGRATRDGYFPRIAGKPAGYLYKQLINFREGRRRYPAMNYMVAHLSDAYLREIADYFAALQLPYPPAQAPLADTAALARGRALVNDGDKARQIPACTTCHGARLTGRLPAIPSLVGLSRDYLNAQFGAWRSGARQADAPDCMAEISRKLTSDDVAALSAWLASQPVPDTMHAEPAKSAALPMHCGSVPQ